MNKATRSNFDSEILQNDGTSTSVVFFDECFNPKLLV